MKKTTAQATDNTTQNNTTNPYTVTQNHGAQTATVDNNTTVSNNGSTKESGSTTTDVKANGPATNTTNNTYVSGDRATKRLSFDGSTEDEVVTNPQPVNCQSLHSSQKSHLQLRSSSQAQPQARIQQKKQQADKRPQPTPTATQRITKSKRRKHQRTKNITIQEQQQQTAPQREM